MELGKREKKKGSEVLPISLVPGEYIATVEKIGREAPGRSGSLVFLLLLSFVYLKNILRTMKLFETVKWQYPLLQ